MPKLLPPLAQDARLLVCCGGGAEMATGLPFTGQGRRVYHREDFASEEAWGDYCWAKGRVGDALLGRLFFDPKPPRVVLDGHDPLVESGARPKNFPAEAFHLDAVLYDPKAESVEGIMEVKTTVTASTRSRLNGACGPFMRVADRGIPLWFGVVRLKSDFPKEIVGPTPEEFLDRTGLAPHVSEAVVYPRKGFDFSAREIWVKPGAATAFRWAPEVGR